MPTTVQYRVEKLRHRALSVDFLRHSRRYAGEIECSWNGGAYRDPRDGFHNEVR